LRPHEVLGVRPDAAPADVIEAFRRYARAHHPDRGGDPATFQAGVKAYRRLLDERGPMTDRAPADVVFHRRGRPGPVSLLRLASRRLASFRHH
jgi:curved DNA-binding protein CbpA